MKAIIYAGISLFSIATVYGVADYYNSQKKGELKKLYVEEEVPKVNPLAEETNSVPLPVSNTGANAVKNTTASSRVKLEKKVKKSKRELKFENFSRGKIREYIQPDSIAVPLIKVKQQD